MNVPSTVSQLASIVLEHVILVTLRVFMTVTLSLETVFTHVLVKLVVHWAVLDVIPLSVSVVCLIQILTILNARKG